MQKINKEKLFKISLTALFISLGLVCRLFLEIMLPFGGAGTMRISLEGIFIALPAIFYGPIYGGAAAGIIDILGTLIKPAGAFIPYITLTAILLGVLRGVFWKLLKNVKVKPIFFINLSLFSISFIIGLFNLFNLDYSGSKSFAFIYLPVILGALGIIGTLCSLFLKNKDIFLKAFLMQLLSGGTVSIINSYILYTLLIAGADMGFMLFAGARFIEDAVFALISAYVFLIILPIIEKSINKLLNK